MPLLAPGCLASLGICGSSKFRGSLEGQRGGQLAVGRHRPEVFVFHCKVLCNCCAAATSFHTAD